MNRFPRIHLLQPARIPIKTPAQPFRHRGMVLSQPGQLGRFVAALVRGLHPIRARMREDFRLAVILLCGLVSALAITPFAVLRFVQGDTVAGLVDLAVVLTIGAANTYVWCTGRTTGAGLVMVAVNTVGCLMVGALSGITGLFWAYTVVVMNFFMAERRPAIAASAVLVLGSIVLPVPGLEALQRISFCVTSALVSLYAYIFATRAARQTGRLEELALSDPLTGVGNRRLLDADLTQAARLARAGGSKPALAVLDLDYFKQVNDRHGHEAGDRTIIDFAALLRAGVRRSDRVYRIGGEEFVLLLLEADGEGLAVVLSKIQSLVRARLRCPGGPVTTSIGAAVLVDGEQAADWLARADQALYAAKRGGRNRTVLDGNAGLATPPSALAA